MSRDSKGIYLMFSVLVDVWFCFLEPWNGLMWCTEGSLGGRVGRRQYSSKCGQRMTKHSYLISLLKIWRSKREGLGSCIWDFARLLGPSAGGESGLQGAGRLQHVRRRVPPVWCRSDPGKIIYEGKYCQAQESQVPNQKAKVKRKGTGTVSRPPTPNFSHLKCHLDLPWPSLDFHDIQWPSMTFYDLQGPYMTFYYLLKPLWPSMIKCLLSRPGLTSGPIQSSPAQINS